MCGVEILLGYAPLLVAGANNLRAGMDALKAAMVAENQANGMVEAEKLNWLDAYVRSYRDLGRMFYDQPKKADAFFKPVPKSKKNNGGGTDVSTPKPPVAKA